MGWKGIAGREQPVKRPADKSVRGWSIGGKGTGGEWERHGLSKTWAFVELWLLL